MLIAQLNATSNDDAWKAFVNCQLGKDKSQFDFVASRVLNKQFAINYDGTLTNLAGRVWTSNALYLNYDPVPLVGFTWRSELFDDSKNAVGVGSTVFQNTVSANFHIAKFTIIPELRYDNARQKIFINSSGNAIGSGASFLIAAVYKW